MGRAAHAVAACAASTTGSTAPHRATTVLLHGAGFEERYAEERRKLAASGERLATDMLAAEAVKLRGIMTGPRASVEGVESELRRCGDAFATLLGSPWRRHGCCRGELSATVLNAALALIGVNSGKEPHSGKETPE